MSWFIQKKTMMKDKIFVIILSAYTVCFCSCKNKNSDDFKCVYTNSIHQFEYYRNTNQIVIRVDSNILCQTIGCSKFVHEVRLEIKSYL